MSESETLEVDVGELIGGKYRLTRKLGHGAMGEVWVARHVTLDDDVAVKILRNNVEGGDSIGIVERFRAEGQIAARLSRASRHVVSVTDHGVERGTPYLVMELLDGRSLDNVLQRKGRLPPRIVAAIAGQVANGLAAAHAEGVLHRDLKPANVFLMRDDRGMLLVKLLDFGIARATGALGNVGSFKTSAGILVGTPAYMSPEQARGLKQLDTRADVWALAVLIYECLARRIPFDGETVEDILVAVCTQQIVPIRQRVSGLPRSLDAFFERAFARDIADRYQRAHDLAEGFAEAVDVTTLDIPFDDVEHVTSEEEPTTLRPPSAASRSLSKRSNKARAFGGAAIAALAGLSAFVAYRGDPSALRMPGAPASASPSSLEAKAVVAGEVETSISPAATTPERAVEPTRPPAEAATQKTSAKSRATPRLSGSAAIATPRSTASSRSPNKGEVF